MPFTVNVKWGKQIFKEVEIDTSKSVEEFKARLFSLSGVAPDRQKVMIPRSGQLKDGSSWEKYKLKNGLTIMLVGTVEEIKAPETAITFVEDMGEGTPYIVDYQPGIMNVGNTCYLNSTVQALAKVGPLQKSLVKYSKESPAGDAVSRQLGGLMGELEQKQNPFLSLGMFLNTFRTTYPQFAEQGQNGAYMQQDAEECFSILLQSMSNVPGIKGDNIISDLFEGEYMTEMSCIGVDGPKDVGFEKFQKIPVHIDAETSFLNMAIKNKMMEHITKHSAELGGEATFEKTSKISSLPYFLNIQFVRFFWRSDKNLRAKICKPVEFPFKLDLFENCTDELKNKLTANRELVRIAEEKQLQKKKGSVAEEKEEENQVMEDVEPELILENDTGLYELLAVVSHQGRSAEGGHYVAWVKRDEENWLLYDDDRVSVVPAADIKKLSGDGGADWHIAYLCIYGTLRKDTLVK